MRKPIIAILSFAVCASLAAPALAADYAFESGADTLAEFGRATSTDEPVAPDPMGENIRRNKDAALLPPPYGVFSGDIPTEPSSPYHGNLRESGFAAETQDLPQAGGEDYAPGGSGVTIGSSARISPVLARSVAPWQYEDGSIGTLHILKTGKTVAVYEGESEDNLKKGAGHFSATSAWDGNVALCGHNRGAWPYFDFVKGLEPGDRIVYETKYGTRTYEIYRKEKISETDASALSWSAENILTLITCVENEAAHRWLAQGKQI
ncbi:MAG: class D sortase [Clostridiales Family XIII bacterium]|jgi:sortase A|nr:class D sortase [Clostridiales Family XIII bacterium]